LKDVLGEAGVPAEDLDSIINMTDQELLQWMDKMGLDADGIWGD
jgi:hypothetical protein